MVIIAHRVYKECRTRRNYVSLSAEASVTFFNSYLSFNSDPNHLVTMDYKPRYLQPFTLSEAVALDVSVIMEGWDFSLA